MTRFITLVLSMLVGSLAYAQAADPTNLPKVAVLELELRKGIKNNAIARDDFKKLTAEELLVTPIPGERPDNLMALFSCEDMNQACLKEVASSLKVQYILFGSLEVAGSGEKLQVSLYDATSNKIISTEESTYLADNRSADMQKTIRKTLRVDGAATIRKPQKIEVGTNPIAGDKPNKRKYTLPVVFGAVGGVLGATALLTERNDVGDGTRNKGGQIAGIAAGSDVMFGVAIGSGLWVALSNKKNKSTSPETPE